MFLPANPQSYLDFAALAQYDENPRLPFRSIGGVLNQNLKSTRVNNGQPHIRGRSHPLEKLIGKLRSDCLVGSSFLTRSSSREVRIRVPCVSVVYFSKGTLPQKRGKRALLGDLVETNPFLAPTAPALLTSLSCRAAPAAPTAASLRS